MNNKQRPTIYTKTELRKMKKSELLEYVLSNYNIVEELNDELNRLDEYVFELENKVVDSYVEGKNVLSRELSNLAYKMDIDMIQGKDKDDIINDTMDSLNDLSRDF